MTVPCSIPSLGDHRRDVNSSNERNLEGILLAPLPAARSSIARHQHSSHSNDPASAFQQAPSFLETRPRTLNHKISLPPLATRQDKSLFSTPVQSPFCSPIKAKADFVPTLTGDHTGEIKLGEKSGRLSGWFSGQSAPVTIGLLPTVDRFNPENPTPVQHSSVYLESTKLPHTSPTMRPPFNRSSATQSSTSNSRFSFFNTKATPEKLPTPLAADDEFLNLDIGAALFPSGPADPFSPSSFKSLLVNAESLLLRLQTAYKLRTSSLHELTAEKKAQDEELEETETRCQHLKQQLDDMSAKVLGQEKAMHQMTEALEKEKRMRREEEEARQKSILLVKSSSHLAARTENCNETCKKVQKRESTATIESDSGFESEEDESPSDFSTAESPPSSISGSTTPEVVSQPQYPPQVFGSPPCMPPKRASTFQQVLRGISTSSPPGGELDEEDLGSPQQWGCANCRGGNAAMAWGMVGDLRTQNKDLKERVEGLEGAVESCLAMVGGLSS